MDTHRTFCCQITSLKTSHSITSPTANFFVRGYGNSLASHQNKTSCNHLTISFSEHPVVLLAKAQYINKSPNRAYTGTNILSYLQYLLLTVATSSVRLKTPRPSYVSLASPWAQIEPTLEQNVHRRLYLCFCYYTMLLPVVRTSRQVLRAKAQYINITKNLVSSLSVFVQREHCRGMFIFTWGRIWGLNFLRRDKI